MSRKQLKKVNKSKKEILSDIQLNQNAERMRSIIKDRIYPFLNETKETISYHKLFLQSLSGLVNGIYDDKAKVITISSLLPELTTRLHSIFSVKDPVQKKELERYLSFLDLIKDVSIHDLSYVTELPRYIDGYILQDKGKDTIESISIDKLLG